MSHSVYRGYKLFCSYLQAKAFNSLGQIGPVQRIVIAVTYGCNSKCKTCGIWQIKSDPSEELTLKDFSTISKARLLAKADEISLTGGEPFLRKDLVEIIKTLSSNSNARFSIVSNGILKDKILSDVKEIVKNGVNSLRIVLSLNGKSETHDEIRGVPGNYSKVMDTIDGLKKHGIEVSLIFTITIENYDEISWAYKLANELSIMINFFPEVNSYKFRKINLREDFNYKQKAEVLSQLKEVYKKRKYYFFDDSVLLYINKMFANEQVCKCYAGLQSLFINPIGDVYPCEGFNNRRLSFGNIKEQGLDAIWRSEKAQAIREYIREGKCQPCYLACEIVPSLRKEIFPVLWFTLKNRLKIFN